MGTVLVDRYNVRCRRCGLDGDFMVGAGMGDLHAVREGRNIHRRVADQRECDAGDEAITVTILQRASHD